MPNDHGFRLTSRRLAGVAIAAIAMIAGACSETSEPSAPVRSAQTSASAMNQVASTIPNSFLTYGLLRQKPLEEDVVVTKTVSSNGGSIDVPGTDFHLQIPKGAFDGKTMTFTVRALAGSTVAYDFEPHGTVFNVPLKFVQGLGHTNLKGAKPAPGWESHLAGAYFPNADMVDPETGLAVVTELLPADIDVTWNGSQISFPIWHFSGYLVSTGRR